MGKDLFSGIELRNGLRVVQRYPGSAQERLTIKINPSPVFPSVIKTVNGDKRKWLSRLTKTVLEAEV